MILEIACFSLEAAIIAEQAGADRIELCSAPLEGGLTPSISMIHSAKTFIKIPVYVMIRPREGDFLYSERELKSMEYDIEKIKDNGIDGVVLGILKSDGSVDVANLTRMIRLAEPMKVTFHRAFDLSQDPVQSLFDLIESGVSRILTSGQKPTALEGKFLIAKLHKLSENKIIIMPGSGVNAGNVGEICTFTSVTEVHASARKIFKGGMKFSNPSVNLHAGSMLTDTDILLPDKEQIRLMKTELNRIIIN